MAGVCCRADERLGHGSKKPIWDYSNQLSQVEKLPPPKCKQIVQILDAFLGSEKVKKSG